MGQKETEKDYQPLLGAGFHKMNIDMIHDLAVKPFPDSLRRKALHECLDIYLASLARTGLTFTVWVDGSFCTDKQNPKDIDLLVLIDENQVNSLSEAEFNLLELMLDNGNCKARYNIDVYTEENTNIHRKAYWRGLFGFLRDETTPKGIIILDINND